MKENHLNDSNVKVRSIRKAAEEIKMIDPNTAINENIIRRLCKEKAIPSTKVSENKTLVNIEDIVNHFSKVCGGKEDE